MRLLAATLLIFAAAVAVAGEVALSQPQQEFRREIAGRADAAEKGNAAVVAGSDGWLFLASELRFLAQGPFWGDAAAKVSRSRKADVADPIPAILDFQRQLRERGIDLLLVPVPPKAAVYPEKIASGAPLAGADAAPYMHAFYDELKTRGVDVLDLTAGYLKNRESAHGPMFCRTDSHWSGAGCVLAAEAIAERVRAKLAAPARKEFDAEWKEASIKGDLAALSHAAAAENMPVRMIAEKGSGAAVQPDANSPLLVMGDSHTLVFHDFLAERAGLIDQLAHELGLAPDLIGTRGSGATAVRISLYRRSHADAGFLAKKKVVVWCFAAREFTEADQGWVQQPIAK